MSNYTYPLLLFYLPHPPLHPINSSEIERLNFIGQGRGGVFYTVIHRLSLRLYTLKVIYGVREVLNRHLISYEIDVLCHVNHPNVVKCHGSLFHQNGEIQLLLDFMDGGSLEGTRITQERFLSYHARQILRGLVHLHNLHIAHRDIRPSNFLVDSRRNVKIADFGISSVLKTILPSYSLKSWRNYMSPERRHIELNRGSSIWGFEYFCVMNQGVYDGCADDIWGFGVSMLEIYLGRYPFGQTKDSWEVPPTASREFRNFIACCLQKEPARRWTAAQLLQHPFISTVVG